jgi:hypothetical protein
MKLKNLMWLLHEVLAWPATVGSGESAGGRLPAGSEGEGKRGASARRELRAVHCDGP